MAAIARRRCGACGSARASRLRRGSTAVTRSIVAPALHEHAVADGELAPLPAGEVRRQRRRRLARLAVEQHRAGAGRDAGHDAAATVRRGVCPRAVRGGSAAARPAVRLLAEQLEQEVLELEPPAVRLVRPERRLAQPGGASCQSVALAGVELGEHASQSSAFLLVHRWRCPSVGFRHGAGAQSARPRASPARAVDRDARRARVPRKRRSGGAEAAYGCALEPGDAGIPLTALAVITSPP